MFTSIFVKLLPPISIKTTITCLIWYTVSSITSQLTKVILTKFPYPLFLSQCQFLIGASLALMVILTSKKFPQLITIFPDGVVPSDTSRSIFSISLLVKILPLGIFQFTGKFFSLTATSLIPLVTVSSIKALSPLLIVLGYRIIYQVIFPYITYLSLTPLLVGVILIIISDSNTNISTEELNNSGVVYCLISTIIFAAQNIYGKQLMSWDNTDINPHNPASLVLNTDLSRPGTPMVDSNEDYFSDNLKSKFVRQRTGPFQLPYSTSDLTLNEKKENHSSNTNTSQYTQIVEQNQTNLNPFAYFIDKFQLDKVSKPDKLTLILYCSLVGSAFSIFGFSMNELPKIYTEFTTAELLDPTTTTKVTISDFVTILILVVLDSLSHFIQSLLAFHLLGSIPALSYSIASMMKRIVIITVSMLVVVQANESHFRQITSQQSIGLGLIAIGLYSYDRWGSRSLKPR
ncbi:putative transporter [Spathaspora sp. JA1]|nr:putative transporter [Spathaspora sp. JA1]